MTEWLPLALAFLAGILLGAFHFGALWWTVRRGVISRHPVLWFSGSMLLRTSVILVGFYFVGRGHWERLVTCLLGFVLARVLVFLRLRTGQAWPTPSTPKLRSRPAPEARHAP